MKYSMKIFKLLGAGLLLLLIHTHFGAKNESSQFFSHTVQTHAVTLKKNDISRIYQPSTFTCNKIPVLDRKQYLSNTGNFLPKEKNLAAIFSPSNLAERSKVGDAAAAILLFSSMRHCSPFGEYLDFSELSTEFNGDLDCKSIPENLLNNPLSILTAAADSGSIDAKLLFAKNAPILAKVKADNYYQQEFIKKTLSTAERYAKEAVAAGSADAYALMAYSYYSGAFGYTDLALAYSYTLASMEKGNVDMENRLTFLERKLTRNQLIHAQQMIGACHVEDDLNGTLTNPFQ